MTQIPTWSSGPVNPTSGRAAPGTTIGGRYALRAAVGHGGMGTVWRASDTLLRRDVAVKEVVLPPGLAASDRDAMYERTLREARAAAAIQHPAVVQVYDVVTEGGRPWIVMELLDARSLADVVIEDGPLGPRAVAKIGIALLGALEVAHAIGVLHRDVKPANVLICSDGRCVLSDFGVARMPTDVQLTTPGMVLGSPHFISPERAMGREFGPPSDLFSLGVTLFTAVEGKPPFDKGDPIETMHSVVEDPPATPVRSGPLTDVLMGLLEKDPARRLDVHGARAQLRELLAGSLASKAPVHQMTDPYAVVQSQVSPWQPPAPPAPQPTGQIGGRAMLAPGESLTDRLANLRQANQQQAAGSVNAAGADTGALEVATGAMSVPTGAMPAAAARPAMDDTMPPVGGMHPVGGGMPPVAVPNALPAGTMPVPGMPNGLQPGAMPAPAGPNAMPPGAMPLGAMPPGGGAVFGPHGMANGGAGVFAPNAAGAVSGASGGAGNSVLGKVRAWPRKLQLAAAGGLAVVLLLGGMLLFNGSDPETAPPQTQASPTATAEAPFQTQNHAARGISVNVPEGWKKTGAGVWIDFTDPEDSGRKVRILVESTPSNPTPTRFLEIAEDQLKKKSSKSCLKPYQQVSLQEVEMAGRSAGELEYTCGEGDTMRHGIWRAVIHDGKAYSFYLTSTDARFAESKMIFEEMVRSFQLTDAS